MKREALQQSGRIVSLSKHHEVMTVTKNIHIATTLLLFYSGFILSANDVNNICVGKPQNWTETRFCTKVLSTCDYSPCESCEDCQIKYPENLPAMVRYSCGSDNQLQHEMVYCPVNKCSYCLACNTSDLAILDTGNVTGVSVCKGCYFEDTIFLDYEATFTGDVGACRVNVSCRSLPSIGHRDQKSSSHYRPVLMSTPVCSRSISVGTPELISVDPERGPVAGGTILTITGNGLTNIARVVVGETMCDPLPFRSSNNDSRLLCRTSSARAPGKVTLKVETAVWPVTWINSDASFYFRPNPKVIDVIEPSTISAGGIAVIFKGLNLGSSIRPVLLVSAICISTQMVVMNFTEECASNEDETNLYCTTPEVDSMSRTASCDLPDILTSRASGSLSSSYRGFEFIMGLQFDGYLHYSSLRSLPQFKKTGYLQVYDNVDFYHFTEEKRVKEVDPSRNNVLIIQGDNMKRGARTIDYDIYLGSGTPCAVLALESNQISCRLPDVAPPIDHNDFFVYKGQDTVIVKVHVGNLQVPVGYVYYVPSLLSTVLLATLLPGAAIIAAVVAIILYIKRRKIEKSSEASTGRVLREQQSFHPYYYNRDRPSQLQTTVSEFPEKLRQELASYIVLRPDITLKEPLGQGQFGKVYRAVLQDNKVVAAKLIKDGSTNVDVVAKFLEEAVLMKDFRHANVLGLCGVVLDVAEPIVLVELMEAGDLRTVIRRESFPLGDLVNFCTQIANGMAFLSAQKFIHRDLASRNCLLDRSYVVKIGDFGLSHDLDAKDYYRSKDRTKPLPVKWMAPESLANGLYTTASDVWSYGVVMWEIMAKGQIPYADVNNYELKRFLLSGRRLDCPTDTPVALYKVMGLCWNAVPSKRPTFFRLLSIIDQFITSESQRCDLERRFTKNIHQETYSYAMNNDEEQALQSTDYLEIVATS